jgi:DNA-binding CsgD family transcriptional regulator
MANSQRLILRDVQSIYRLLGECRDLGADPVAWQKHLYEGTASLIGAQVATGGEILLSPKGPEVVSCVDLGWEGERERNRFLEFQSGGEPASSEPFGKFVRELDQQSLATRCRQQVIDDREWYGSEHFNEYSKVSRIDACLVSLCMLPDLAENAVSIMTFYRPLGQRQFESRERRLVRLLHDELHPLIGRQLASSDEPSASRLAPRQREVLHHLLNGDSEKQIARRLGLTPQSLHQYVKAVYRHFDVHSRAELLARWIRVPSGETPQKNGNGRIPPQ